jgi:hypothetical protein
VASSSRLSRGFHRLTLFLAAIPLLVGGFFSVSAAYSVANTDLYQHQRLMCAHEHLGLIKSPPNDVPTPRDDSAKSKTDTFWADLAAASKSVDLKSLGYSDIEGDFVPYEDALHPPAFIWLATFGYYALIPSLLITLAVAFAIYALVRGIGLACVLSLDQDPRCGLLARSMNTLFRL